MATTAFEKVKTVDRIGPQETKLLRKKLAPTEEQLLTQEEFARLLGVSWSTVSRWETGATRPDISMREKLERLWLAVELLNDMVAPQHRVAFFQQRHPLFMNLRPIDLLETKEGTELVLNLLREAATGSFA